MNPNQRNFLAIKALVLCLVLSAACAIHTPPPTGQPIPKTPLQWVIIYNAAVAKADRTLETSVETLQSSGTITVAQARPIIVACGQIATVSTAIEGITSKSTEATWNVDGPAIRALLSAVHLNLSPTANAAVDIGVATLNAALLLLTQGVQ